MGALFWEGSALSYVMTDYKIVICYHRNLERIGEVERCKDCGDVWMIAAYLVKTPKLIVVKDD